MEKKWSVPNKKDGFRTILLDPTENGSYSHGKMLSTYK